MTLIEDRQNSATAEVTIDGGARRLRQFLVTDLAGDASARTGAALVYPGMPQRLDGHPNDPDLQVGAIRARALDATKAVAEVDYAKLTPIVRVGASLMETDTSVDSFGDPLAVTYQGTDFSGPEPVSLEPDTQIRPVRIQVPQPIVSVSHVGLDTTHPSIVTPAFLVEAIQYVGSVNDIAWHGGLPRQWLCTRVEARSADQTIWEVTYDFQFNGKKFIDGTATTFQIGWDIIVYYKDPATQQIPGDVIAPGLNPQGIPQIGTGNGVWLYRVYPEERFADIVGQT